MVPFSEFWNRLKAELAKGPSASPGHHGVRVAKWSPYSGTIPGEFVALWQGGDVLYCETETTNSMRSVSKAEFQKVYKVWPDYRAGVRKRSYIVHDLGVQNASWIIPILFKYEHLMK